MSRFLCIFDHVHQIKFSHFLAILSTKLTLELPNSTLSLRIYWNSYIRLILLLLLLSNLVTRKNCTSDWSKSLKNVLPTDPVYLLPANLFLLPAYLDIYSKTKKLLHWSNITLKIFLWKTVLALYKWNVSICLAHIKPASAFSNNRIRECIVAYKLANCLGDCNTSFVNEHSIN